MKTNFLASWDEIGDDCEMEDTYSLSTMKDLDGTTTDCPFCLSSLDNFIPYNFLNGSI